MTPIKVTFSSGQSLVIYSEDPDAFSRSVTDNPCPEITHIAYSRDAEDLDQPELQEVTILLKSGAAIIGMMAKTELPKADFIDEIQECSNTSHLAYANMKKEELEIDARLAAVKQFSNTMPCPKTREYLHREYLKRKRAYAAALEALIESVVRRPNP